jgi:hypothetical protein
LAQIRMFNQSLVLRILLLLLLLLLLLTNNSNNSNDIYIHIYSLKERGHLEDLDAADGRARIEQNLRNSVGIDLVHVRDSRQLAGSCECGNKLRIKQPTRCIKYPKPYFVIKFDMFRASSVPIIRS